MALEGIPDFASMSARVKADHENQYKFATNLAASNALFGQQLQTASNIAQNLRANEQLRLADATLDLNQQKFALDADLAKQRLGMERERLNMARTAFEREQADLPIANDFANWLATATPEQKLQEGGSRLASALANAKGSSARSTLTTMYNAALGDQAIQNLKLQNQKETLDYLNDVQALDPVVRENLQNAVAQNPSNKFTLLAEAKTVDKTMKAQKFANEAGLTPEQFQQLQQDQTLTKMLGAETAGRIIAKRAWDAMDKAGYAPETVQYIDTYLTSGLRLPSKALSTQTDGAEQRPGFDIKRITDSGGRERIEYVPSAELAQVREDITKTDQAISNLERDRIKKGATIDTPIQPGWFGFGNSGTFGQSIDALKKQRDGLKQREAAILKGPATNGVDNSASSSSLNPANQEAPLSPADLRDKPPGTYNVKWPSGFVGPYDWQGLQ